VKVKAKSTIAREYKRVGDAIIKLREDPSHAQCNLTYLDGARQALAWALSHNAMQPSKCVSPLLESKEKSL